ncbi:MAG: hypothetical protein K8R02_05420 [Anaerohalosphaeraceae bacterium]|nr:hypothetical protein [Anaerohalosphaeraceae bacterium]
MLLLASPGLFELITMILIVGLVAGVSGAVIAAVVLGRKSKADSSDQAEAFAELAKLTGGLAHEIKNPLSIVKVNLQLVAENLGSDRADVGRAADKINVVRKETDRLEQILDDFLRYIGKPELQTVSVDINTLAGDVFDFYSPQAHNNFITMRHSLCDENLNCMADADMLKQVLLNMFINAQQAMSGGGELMLRTEKRGRNAVITISDTGIGMEPEKQKKIFEAYYSSRKGGSGLGLSISKKIINAHNGTVKVDSVCGKGTSFTIALPLIE